MLVHLVADYGPGDLAAAEVHQQLAVHLPAADVVYTPVAPFDTVAAGFVVAQLALTDGPAERLVYSNVAPRADEDEPRPDNEGEGLVAVRLPSGVLVVGVDAGHVFSFLGEEVEELHEVEVPDTGSQFRSRDAFPPLLPRLLADDPALLGAVLPAARVPPPPERALAYVDGYGNLKTTWRDAPVGPGERVEVRIGDVTADAVVGDGTFDVPAGGLSFAPGSSGWRRRDGSTLRWYELLARGGSAAEVFGLPATGTPVSVAPRPSG